MGYTSKYKGAEIDALLDKVEALPEGGGEGGSAPMMIEVTWEELVALRDAANLTVGQMYRITDYETMTSKEGSRAAGHPFDIIVTALDNKTLDEKASAIWSARDTEGYFANSNLPDWDVRYCLDNDKGRFDWAVAKGKTLIIDGSSSGLGEPSATIDGTFEYEGVTYFKWPALVEGMEVYFLTTSDSPLIGDDVIIYVPSFSMALPKASKVKAVEEKTTEGKGVVYYMEDENANDAPYDFKNILFLRKVTSEGIIDNENGEDNYVYTFSEWKDGIIKDASEGCMMNHIGEKCWDNVFLGVFPLAIFMQNKITGGSVSNSFGSSCFDNHIENSSSNTFGGLCLSNYLQTSSRNTFGDNSAYNRLAVGCADNTVSGNYNILEAACSRNTVNGVNNSFAIGCEDNILKKCHQNTFHTKCKSNVLEFMSSGNVFEPCCDSNKLDEYCNDNEFHTQCTNNVLGKNSWYNTFGIYCTNNNFGERTKNVVLGNVCSNNKFATTSAGDIIASYFQNIEFGGGCSNLTLWCAQATSSSKMVKNIKIAAGLSSSVIEIPVINAQYVQTVAKNSSGEVKVYCEADLVQ